jgi:hypothetical protein
MKFFACPIVSITISAVVLSGLNGGINAAPIVQSELTSLTARAACKEGSKQCVGVYFIKTCQGGQWIETKCPKVNG